MIALKGGDGIFLVCKACGKKSLFVEQVESSALFGVFLLLIYDHTIKKTPFTALLSTLLG